MTISLSTSVLLYTLTVGSFHRSSLSIRGRLLDIVHADQKLYLVFEFLDVDLKRYMENGNHNGEPIQLDTVKVRALLLPLSVDLIAVAALHPC
jgi:hypothetical protein